MPQDRSKLMADYLRKRNSPTTTQPIPSPATPQNGGVYVGDVSKELWKDLGKGVVNSAANFLVKGTKGVKNVFDAGYDATLGRLAPRKQSQIDQEEQDYNTYGKGALSSVRSATTPKIMSEGVQSFLGDSIVTAPLFGGVSGLARTAALSVPVKSALARAVTKGALEAGGSAIVSALGSEDGERSKNAKVAGATSGVLSLLGSAVKASNLPEKLYRRTYKTTAQEIGSQMKDKGESLASFALKKVKPGSLKSQAEQLTQMVDDSEKALVAAAKKNNVRLDVDPDLADFARRMEQDYAKSPYKKEILSPVKSFLSSIDENGKADVSSSLFFKKAMDKLRSEGSFNSPVVGSDLKGWSNYLREKVNNIGNIGAINKEYSKAIQALKAVQRKAAQEGNKQLVGALEMYTAVAPGVVNPAGLAAVFGKRLLNSPKIQTNLAQIIKNSSKPGIGKSLSKSSLLQLLQGINLPKTSPTGRTEPQSQGQTESQPAYRPSLIDSYKKVRKPR